MHQAAKLVAALLKVAGITVGLTESNATYRLVYDSRHLQTDCQEPGSAPEPYARNRVWATFYQFITHSSITHISFQTCHHIMSIAQTLTLLNLTDVICLCCSLHDWLFV